MTPQPSACVPCDLAERVVRIERARHRRSHRCRRAQSGVTLVEFSLVAPTFLLVVLGLFITSLVVMNLIQLNNAVRDGARAAALCGGIARTNLRPVPTMPDGSTACSTANVQAYVANRLNAIPGGVSPTVTVTANAQSYTDLDQCNYGGTVEIGISYAQPLYLPYLDRIIGDGPGTGTRTVSAIAEATCEQ